MTTELLDLTAHPYIGQILDYYPHPSERFPALCVQVLPNPEGGKPKVNLQVFLPNGELQFKKEVPFANEEDSLIDSLEACWGFQHQFAILQKEDHDSATELGTETNLFIGHLNTQLY